MPHAAQGVLFDDGGALSPDRQTDDADGRFRRSRVKQL